MTKGSWCNIANRTCQKIDCSDCELYYKRLFVEYEYIEDEDYCCKDKLR